MSLMGKDGGVSIAIRYVRFHTEGSRGRRH